MLIEFIGLPLQLLRIFKDEHWRITIYSDLDHALEWCEDELLKSSTIQPEKHDIKTILKSWLTSDQERNIFLSYLKQKKVKKSEYIFRQGDSAKYIYILEAGHASVYFESDKHPKRLAKVKEGSLIGEMGVFRNTTRFASFIADIDCVFYTLSQEDLEKLQDEQPRIASHFHHKVSCLLSERLANTTKNLIEL